MEKIKLNGIVKRENIITYDFSFSEGLVSYFSGKPFIIEYPEDIENVPDAVLAVPFVCNVLPIVWLMDCELYLDELDKAFWDCIPKMKKGYETMYPEIIFAGIISVDKVILCDSSKFGKSATFFSGGLDAVNTLIRHMDEKPALISIWGADIRYENTDGWKNVHKGIEEYAQKYDLSDIVIRSTLREFDNENALLSNFRAQLRGGWWHDVKHGIGLLGHAAPYAYLHGISNVYIASSNCPEDGPVQCASNPLIDNQVRYANARVIHDGFEFSRQDKVRNVVDYVTRMGDQLSLHVCWESQEGNNCCKCEKCYRTMAGIIAEGVNPIAFGFADAPKNIPLMYNRLIVQKKLSSGVAQRQWCYIGDRMKINRKKVRRLPFWKDVKWMMKADFRKPQTLYISKEKEIRRHLSNFRFYQFLHKIKEKL